VGQIFHEYMENLFQSRENLGVRKIFRVRQIFHDTGTNTTQQEPVVFEAYARTARNRSEK